MFEDIVFGPLHSRRFGSSLGINLLPLGSKWCNYNCIYCECGWNANHAAKLALPQRSHVRAALSQRLQELGNENKLPDAITFSGNGEPTMHPDFAAIIDDVMLLRNKYAGRSRICVLTNAVNIGKDDVCGALKKVDTAMLKLDAGSDDILMLINQPQCGISVNELTTLMQKFGSGAVIQSMFLRGEIHGRQVDNSLPEEVSKWLDVLQKIQPSQVAIYTIDRATPAERLHKIPMQRLHEIAHQVNQAGISAIVF
jgi:wyosine [tRNA(Phe)-imidazoG37] synthetase (radical SAM superfamily)